MNRRTCFGDLGGRTGCWGYQLKLVPKREDTFLKDVRLFPYKSIQKATNNFRTMLGQGGYSSSYKGTLDDGTVVAVEVHRHVKGDSSETHRVEFIPLIKLMSRIRHRNVIEFIGCCVEGDHWLIVYEFAGDQRLDQVLFDSFKRNMELTWPRRASICLGIARGLEYLHNGISRQVVHRDIKPSNILVDENYNPKIAGFEIAYPFDDDAVDKSGIFCGTLGYIDPEYCTTGRFTDKTDVFAFGVLLLEVISGKKAIDFLREARGLDIHLMDWAREQQEHDRVLEIVDPRLTEFPKEEVTHFIDVALCCVQSSSDLRPSTSEVLLMLLGGYGFNKKGLRKPDLPLLDKNLEIYEQNNDYDTSIDIHHKASASAVKFERSSSLLVTATKGKMIREDEIEIETDPETEADSEAELMQTSQDLESELYTSIEPKISGPSDETLVNPEMINIPSESDVLVEKGGVEVAEQMLISHDRQGELSRLTEPSISTTVSISESGPEASHEVSTSAQDYTILQSEVKDEDPFQEEDMQRNSIVLPRKVDPKRPIHSTVENVIKALGDGQSRRICLRGRSGSGKTTVLKTLLHHPSSYLFDEVIYVTFPRVAHQRMIQNEIIQQLSLNRTESYSEDEMAGLIFQTLTTKKVLLLFDDIWETINLHDVGIPDPSPDNSCWLVLATRSLDVCRAMADREIEMELLSKVEAWGLFRNQVGYVVDSPEIEPYARAIVDECQGLPLIIASVASVLKMKSNVMEWKFALWSFQIPDTHITDNLFSLSPQIKYCYHKLKGRDVKTCFLYCAFFPRGIEIDITKLVDCFIAEGLLGARTLAAHKRGYDIVGQLVNASLLEATEDGSKVKMHNIIKDSALEIFSSDGEGYETLTRYYLRPHIVPLSEQDKVRSSKECSSAIKYLTGASAQLKEAPILEEWAQAEMIFLMDNELSHLPSKLNCPNLQALFLQGNSCLRVIPASFFDGMSALRILNLSKTRIKSLPESFSNLKNLEVLALRDCERLLMLPSSIGVLKALQVLDLEGSELMHLPETVGELASLKYLRVSFYGSINLNKYRELPAKLIPSKTISILDLRELGIFVHPGDAHWTSCASEIVEEISNLQLSSLHFHFPEVDHLNYFLNRSQSWTNSDLAKFNFIVGHDFKHVISQVSWDADMMYSGEERCLRFVNGEDIPLAVQVVLSRSTSFYLDHHLSLCSLTEFGIEIIHFLKICILRDCPKLLAIVDTDSAAVVLPYLEYLSINYLWNLEKICVDHLQTGSLAKLRVLSVRACPKLRYVFTTSMLHILTNLEELVIEDNASLEYMVIEDKEAIDDDASRCHGISRYPVLRSLKVLKLHYLPKLNGIWIGRWPPLEYMSFYNCPKLKKLHLLANDALNIKEIEVDKPWWDSLDWDDMVLARQLLDLVRDIDIDDL